MVAPILDNVPHFAHIDAVLLVWFDINFGSPYIPIKPMIQPMGAKEIAVNIVDNGITHFCFTSDVSFLL